MNFLCTQNPSYQHLLVGEITLRSYATYSPYSFIWIVTVMLRTLERCCNNVFFLEISKICWQTRYLTSRSWFVYLSYL